MDAGTLTVQREILEGDAAGKSRMMAFGLASLNAAITRAAIYLMAEFLLLASWVTMLVLKTRTSAATFAMNSASADRL